MNLLIQIGHEIEEDVYTQFGEPIAVISRLEYLKINQIRLAAAECYTAIIETVRAAKKEGYDKILVVISGPSALNFILGQLIGLHLNIDLAYWYKGEYIIIPGATRDLLLN